MEELNRTFIGIRLSPEIQAKLGEVQQALRHKAGSDVARWNQPNMIQLTIMPLGELLIGTFDQVRRSLPGITAQARPFELTVEGVGGSPSNLQPRFIWIGMGGESQNLILLHNSLETVLRPMLRDYQPRPFVPHIDLGRIKIESEQNRTALGRAIRMTPVGCVATLQVSQIELFRSTATSMGPQLISEGTFALGS